LLTEVANLTSTNTASTWAQAALRDKNSLNAGDSKAVEKAFEQKLKELAQAEPLQTLLATASEQLADRVPEQTGKGGPVNGGAEQPSRIDKSVLVVVEPRRYRNREHLRFVIQQPCLVCGRKPSDPHHLRFMQPRALGRKVSDEFAVPLCRGHHRALHRAGEEKTWWQSMGIDPVEVARNLWQQTHANEARLLEPDQNRRNEWRRAQVNGVVEIEYPGRFGTSAKLSAVICITFDLITFDLA
jgi:hypothetical protein